MQSLDGGGVSEVAVKGVEIYLYSKLLILYTDNTETMKPITDSTDNTETMKPEEMTKSVLQALKGSVGSSEGR